MASALGLDDQRAEVRPGRDLEHDRLVALVGFLGGELLVPLEPGPVLGHPGPGRHPDPLQLAGELLAAGALLLLLEGQPGLLLLQPGRVVALPGDALAAVELEDPLGHVVEEVAVVGHEDDGAGILREVPFQPGDALGVEVVGRLVEQQDVGPLEQDLAERDAPPLAAGEGADLGVAGRQAHGVHGDLDPPVEVPALGGLDGVLDLRLLLEQLVHLVGVGPLAQPGVDLVEPVEQAANVRHGLLDVAADVLARVERRLLRHIADRDPRRRPRGADEIVVEPGHDPSSSVLLPDPLPPMTPILAPG